MKGTSKLNNRTAEGGGAGLRSFFGNKFGGMVAIALCAALSTSGAIQAQGHMAKGPVKGPFSGIVVFGDSLSDMGNFYQATGIPPFPYWEGRASDGPVWVEYLAAKLGIPLDRDDVFAWLGSTTGYTNFRDMPDMGVYFPGFQQQIDAYLAAVGEEGADPRALYTVWIGPNDFFDWLVKQDKTPDQLVQDGVANTVQGILDLAGAGARHFIVGNIPDLGMTPDGQALEPFVSEALSGLCVVYNAVLEEQLAALEAGLGIYITRLDAYSIVNQMAAEPTLFGLANVTEAAIASYPSVDSSEYLFWDGVHPTTAAHEWTADFVCAELVQTYRPRKARGKGPTSPRSLNGRVRASECRN